MIEIKCMCAVLKHNANNDLKVFLLSEKENVQSLIPIALELERNFQIILSYPFISLLCAVKNCLLCQHNATTYYAQYYAGVFASCLTTTQSWGRGSYLLILR